MMNHSTFVARREFLKFVVASPYVAALGGAAAFLQERGLAQRSPEVSDVITDPKDALSVFDFEEAARRKVLPGDRKSTRLNSSHIQKSRMPSSA